MQNYKKEFYYDKDLDIELYAFSNITNSFPSHFHDYYVIGIVENGERILFLKDKEHILKKGDIFFFNPKETHSCINKEPFKCKIFHIQKNTMSYFIKKITGKNYCLKFINNVYANECVFNKLLFLYKRILVNDKQKKEILMNTLKTIIEKNSKIIKDYQSTFTYEINLVCSFMKEHYKEHIDLKQLCEYSNLSKSTLSRYFIKSIGVTPYRYLQILRIEKAKELLNDEYKIIDIAINTGFTDQSHFSNLFRNFIGIPPGLYKSHKKISDTIIK